MFEKFICEEVFKGNCHMDCTHEEPHEFYKGYCNEHGKCPELNKKVKCVEISMENYI